jgi:hypothetical protein
MKTPLEFGLDVLLLLPIVVWLHLTTTDPTSVCRRHQQRWRKCDMMQTPMCEPHKGELEKREEHAETEYSLLERRKI